MSDSNKSKFISVTIAVRAEVLALVRNTCWLLGAVALLAFYPNNASAWESKYAYYKNGKLTYYSDAEKNRIPDYSYAGYKYGESPIPVVPEVASLTPVAGDNTARIQQALDKVGARRPDANGIRGALVLGPGVYQINGTVNINKSGVVLRGSGDGADALANTILTAPGDSPHQRTVVVLGSGNSKWTETRVRSDITTPFVQVGSKSFEVQSAAAFAVGDEIIVHHPSSQAWIDAVDGGGVGSDEPWRPGQMDIPFLRRITAISGTFLTLDVPVYNHLNRDLAQSYIAKAVWTPVILSGVENLRIDIQTDPDKPKDENHAKNGVSVVGARDCWVQKVTALHFLYAAVRTEGAFCVTVDSCQGLDPVGIRTGGRFYNFCADRRSQCVLFTKCHATGARHGYVSNGTSSVSGLVFFRCTSNGGTDMEAGHRWWTQGVLFDNMFEERRGSLRLINRGDWGTQHGWGSVHSVVWNFNRGMYIQKPPTAQNYGISSTGTFPTGFPFSGEGPQGVTEQKSGELVPASLYEAQLSERLNAEPQKTGAKRPSARRARSNKPAIPKRTVKAEYAEAFDAKLLAEIDALAGEGNFPTNKITLSISRTPLIIQGADPKALTVKLRGGAIEKDLGFRSLTDVDRAKIAMTVAELDPTNQDLAAVAAFMLECAGRSDMAKGYFERAGESNAMEVNDSFELLPAKKTEP